MTRDEKDVASEFLANLSKRVGPERFATWFGRCPKVAFQAGRLQIEVVSPFVRDWLKAKFSDDICEACEETFGPVDEIVFALANAPAPLPKSLPRARRQKKDLPRSREAGCDIFPGDERPPGLESLGGPSHQLVGAPSLGWCARLEDVVVGPPNQLAVTSALRAAEKPGEHSPLFLHGPTAVGKSHLLRGIWQAIRSTRGSAVVVHLSSEEFTCRFLEALHGSGLPSFRRKYRHVDAFLLDDVHFLKGKKATQVELVHTLDALSHKGKQLVFAADRLPRELDGVCDELKSRLESGICCQLDPPDQAMRAEMIRRFARKLELDVPPEVVEWLASSIRGHARALIGAVQRLRMASQAFQQPISMALAKRCLGDLLEEPSRPVTLARIEQAVCDVCQISARRLASKERSREASEPRMLAMFLARKLTKAALSEIGRKFGGRSHSTVVAANHKIEKWLRDPAGHYVSPGSLRVDEAVRRIETLLRSG